MANNTIRLSEQASDMIQTLKKKMEEEGFKNANLPLLLLAYLDTDDAGEDGNFLENYLVENNPMAIGEIEETLSMMLSERHIIPPAEAKKANKAAMETVLGKKKAQEIIEESLKNSKSAYASSEKSEDTEAKEEEKAEDSSKEVSNEEAAVENKDDDSSDYKDDSDNESDDDSEPEITFELFYYDCNGKKVSFKADDDVFRVQEALMEIIETYEVKEITPVHFLLAMFKADLRSFKDFFKELEESYTEARKYFKAENVLKVGIIPFNLAPFMNTFNDGINPKKPCEILMRDKEANKLWNIMLKKNKRNAVIVGEAGVGKTALVEKITYDIVTGNCPKEFIGFNVISLDVNSLIAGTSYRGDAEQRISDIIKFLETTHNVILFIDEVHTILGAGSCFEGEMDLANALKPILARGDTIVIGATTEHEYELYFKKDAALSRRFEKVVVEEPKSKDVYPMIRNKLRVLSKFHGVRITKPVVEYTIMIANCFAFEKMNPDKTLDLIDRAMVSAKRHNKKYVDKECVLDNFDIFFERFEKMSKRTKLATAYHEAGHYVIMKASGRLTKLVPLAISIMPAEDYLGVTVHEEDDTVTPDVVMEYYIDLLAMNFGGRVAEKIFTETYAAGASSDLEHATTLAYRVITELGMCDDKDFENIIYLNTEEVQMFTEKRVNLINDQVKKLLEKGYKRAEEILTENSDILEAIAKALVKNQIMSEAQLDKIWKKTVKLRDKQQPESKKEAKKKQSDDEKTSTDE